MSPTVTRRSVSRHAGHAAGVASASARARRAPQWGQNAAPSNISAKHYGQLTVASRAWQYGQRFAAGSADGAAVRAVQRSARPWMDVG